MKIIRNLFIAFWVVLFGLLFWATTTGGAHASEWHPTHHYHFNDSHQYECDLGCHATFDDCDEDATSTPPVIEPPATTTPPTDGGGATTTPPTDGTSTTTPPTDGGGGGGGTGGGTVDPSPAPTPPSSGGGGGGGGGNGPIWGSLPTFTNGSGTSTNFTPGTTSPPLVDTGKLIDLYRHLVTVLLKMKIILSQPHHYSPKG